MNVGINGLNLIKASEGFRSKMYLDANDLPTIGYGTLIDTKAEEYLKTAVINESQAVELLAKDCIVFENAIKKMVQITLNQNQFDALVCLVYNIGPSNFQKSSVLGAINKNSGRELVEKSWKLWCRGDGRVLKGLVIRRQKEVDLFYAI